MHNDKISLRGRRSADCGQPLRLLNGSDRGGRSVNPQRSQRYLHVSLLKPLLDDGFGKTDRSVLCGCRWW